MLINLLIFKPIFFVWGHQIFKLGLNYPTYPPHTHLKYSMSSRTPFPPPPTQHYFSSLLLTTDTHHHHHVSSITMHQNHVMPCTAQQSRLTQPNQSTSLRTLLLLIKIPCCLKKISSPFCQHVSFVVYLKVHLLFLQKMLPLKMAFMICTS